MQHPILGIFLYLLMGLFVLAAAYGVVAPLVDKTPPSKIKTLAISWALLLFFMPLPTAYLSSFMEDKKVTYLHELGHDWFLFLLFFGGFSISLYRRWRRKAV